MLNGSEIKGGGMSGIQICFMNISNKEERRKGVN